MAKPIGSRAIISKTVITTNTGYATVTELQEKSKTIALRLSIPHFLGAIRYW